MALTEYGFWKKCSVIATAAGAQNNYQLELVVGESSSASGADVHCNGHCLNFPNDIRFTKEDGTTKHDYWMDTDSLTGVTPNQKVNVWIEVSSIPASGFVDFYMYYGKASDSGESDGDNTFIFFDGFDGVQSTKLFDVVAVEPQEKYAGNPILEHGETGDWDEFGIRNNCLLIDPYGNPIVENGKYIVYYVGKTPGGAVGRATFERPNVSTISNMTEEPTNPVMTKTDMGWATGGVGPDTVIKRGPNDYIMFFHGNDTTFLNRIYYATSADGLSWTPNTTAILEIDGHALTMVDVKEIQYGVNAGLKVLYVEYDSESMYYASSNSWTSGWTWDSNNPIITADDISWAVHGPCNSKFLEVGIDKYIMGINAAGTDWSSWQGGFMTSTSLNSGWTDYGKVVLPLGADGSWDDHRIESLELFKCDFGESIVGMLYFGCPTGASTDGCQIGYATIEQNAINDILDIDKWTEETVGDGNLSIADSKVRLQGISTNNYSNIYTAGLKNAPCALRILGWNAVGIGNIQARLTRVGPYINTTDVAGVFLLDQNLGGGGNSDVYGKMFYGSSSEEKWRDQNVGDTYDKTDLDILISNDRKVEWKIEGVSKGVSANALDDESWRIQLIGIGGRGISDVYINTVFLRNYTSPEPTWGTWGGEEKEPEIESSQTEDGKIIFDGISEEGRIVLVDTLLEDGQIICAKTITKVSCAGLSISQKIVKESSAGLSISAESDKVSSAGLQIVTRFTKESSATLNIAGDVFKQSSAGLAISEKTTKESSASLSVSNRYTKESSAGLRIVTIPEIESSASLAVKASYIKESSAGLHIVALNIKESSATLAISGKNTLVSSAGLFVFKPALNKGLFYGKLGNAILETVMPESFRITEEINRIPSFEFEVANSEVNRTAIAANATELFKIYWQHHGVDTHIFTGIINVDGIEYISLSHIRITGFASYAKLGWPLYKHLNSEDAESVNTVFDFHGTYTDYTTQANNANINDVIVGFGGENQCFYVGEANPFWGLQVKYSTKGIPAGAVVVTEFSKGGGTWEILDVLDETYAFTEEPGTYDVIIPHPPSDWARNIVDGISKFWLRWRIVSGAYTTSPKLDRIHTVNVDVYRVFYLATSARAILLDVLEDTEYSMDAIDVCPEDKINLLAEYESPLRIIAAIPAALTWIDTDGSKKSYQWWIDEAKKVHIKKERGTTHSDDITGDLTIFNNLVDYFNISNRLIGFSKRDGLSQIRAIIENKASQTTHALRTLAVPKNEIGKYQTLKASLEKDITYSKDPMQRIKGSVTTDFWGQHGFEVGDRVILHQGEWVVEEGAFQIVKADIGPILTQLNLGISREHLEGLKSNLKRAFDISNVQMHGSTSLLTAGPQTSNYERKSDGSVFSAKLKIEIPSEVVKTHKVLLSWTIGPYRASVNENSNNVPGHDHGGSANIGGAILSGSTGEDGGFTPDVSLDGLHTPVMLNGKHNHHLKGAVGWNYVIKTFYPVLSNAVFGGSHRHSGGGTGYSNDDAFAVNELFAGTTCDSGWCISSYTGRDFATDEHYHQNSDTGYTTPSMTIDVGLLDGYVQKINDITVDIYSDDEDPVHAHTGSEVSKHDHQGVIEQDHDHVTPAIIGHADHSITADPLFNVSMNYGIHEEPAGTILELLVNSEKVGEYSGEQKEIRVDGYLTGSTNTIEIQPIASETNKKGSATISGSGILFIEPKHF